MSRLVRSHLVERAPADRLVEVVRDVCGIHAQVMGSAELQLAARVDGITQADVREALWERRELVKTWTLRGTLHIHPADELSALDRGAARRSRARPTVGDGLENVDEVVAAIGEALRGRAADTRGARRRRRRARRAGAARASSRPAGATTSSDAAIAGVLCFGPPQGAEGDVRASGRLARAAAARGSPRRRCARSRAGTRPPTARSRIASSGSGSARASARFEELDFPEPKESAATTQSVRLLPEYDVYVMGFRDRDTFVPPAVREQIKAHGKGRYEGPAGTPFLLVDGICAGIWRRRRRRRSGSS